MQTETAINTVVMPPPEPEPPEKRLALVVNRANLAIAKLVLKVHESRYTLSSVNFTRKHTEVTNGHMAVRVTLPEVELDRLPDLAAYDVPFTVTERDGFTPFSILATEAGLIEKAIPNERTLTILNHAQVNAGDNGHAQFATTNLDRDADDKLIAPVATIAKLETQFPNIDAVLPKAKDKVLTEIKVDAELLLGVLKAAIEFKHYQNSKKNTATVALRFRKNTRVFEVECNNHETGQNFYALVMPMSPDCAA